MRLAVITDVHANYPALKAVLGRLKKVGYDRLVHTGDAIAIGPQPRECLELLLELDDAQLIMGNHDDWYAHGLPEPRPPWMSRSERQHQLWTHNRLGTNFRQPVASWPWFIEEKIRGVGVRFLHYAMREDGRTFKAIRPQPSAQDLDVLFGDLDGELIFFGHDHSYSNVHGHSHYVNPGSLGCQKTARAPYCLVDFANGNYRITCGSEPYDDRALYEAFERLQVPAREFIYEAFFGGRFRSPTSFAGQGVDS